MPKVHPTAIVHSTAVLSDGVEIGAYSIVEADVVIGPGTVLRDHAILRRYTTIGQNNIVDSYAVLGGLPQDLKFNPRTASYLRVGDDNVFREGVTISRATGEGEATGVGNRTYWMTTAHAGHNAVVEDDRILVNGSALAGHTLLAVAPSCASSKPPPKWSISPWKRFTSTSTGMGIPPPPPFPLPWMKLTGKGS